MGKLAKLFLLIIFLIAVCFPPVTVKVSDVINQCKQEAAKLGENLKDTEGKLRTSEEERDELNATLDAEKEKSAGLARSLSSVEQQLGSVKAELKRKAADLNRCVSERKKLEQQSRKLQEEKSALEEKLLKEAEELAALKKIAEEFETREKEPAVSIRPVQEIVYRKGKLLGTYGSRFMTVGLGSKIGGGTPTLFVHRRGKVLGKVAVRRIHEATVVIETNDEELLRQIRAGDRVELEGEELLPGGFLEGRVSTVSLHGFAGIDIDREPRGILNPVFLIYRGEELVGRLESEKVVSLIVVAELGAATYGMRIARGDYLRMPR